MSTNNDEQSLEKIVNLCKRRGFVFPGSDIYGGLAGTYDMGPLGVMLSNNIKASWMKKFVDSRDDMYPLDASIVMNSDVWRASGHVDTFTDPLVEDLKTHKRYRADHLLEEAGVNPLGMSLEQMTEALRKNKVKSPDGNDISDVRSFNMMLATKVGASDESANETYLRPETAQGIFVNFKNIIDAFHPKLPFGIAQIGKAFRNEITPRNFLFRVREFEQMEIEYFVHPDDSDAQFEYWKKEIPEWLASIGLDMNKVVDLEIDKADLAHYSRGTVDFEFIFPFGQKELYGLANRGDYDLVKHSETSGVQLDYTDPQTNERFFPHIIEPSVGLGRVFLALLLSVYKEEKLSEEDTRSYLALPPHMAPYKVAVSPLLKNKPELVERARHIYRALKDALGNVAWDDNGNIGKRYRRQDEIGTPYCVVIDFDTLETDDCVSVRHRDTMEQERVKADNIVGYIQGKME